MKRVHLIGRKNHGKTTLVSELVAEFRRRGLRVGTIKHTHHQHELDTPGKDSHRHRESGAVVVGILTRSMSAVFRPHAEECTATGRPDNEARYAAMASAFADCDLVLVEGDVHTTALKLEVWRAGLDTEPLARKTPGIRAIITDDAVAEAVPVLPRRDLPRVADFILEVLNEKSTQICRGRERRSMPEQWEPEFALMDVTDRGQIVLSSKDG